MTTWHVEKTGEDSYHVHGGDQFTRIEEDVDGSKLMGMLTSKGLSAAQIGEIMGSLGTKESGYQTTIAFNPPNRKRNGESCYSPRAGCCSRLSSAVTAIRFDFR